LAFVLALVIAAAIVGVVLAAHLVIGRRRARVFISFQHERESVADVLASEMETSGIGCTKLPFVENPDHDALLDQVRQAIRHCDVFVCVPGNRPSFVENEVSMAFGLEKPLLFVVVEADTPRLPNTAKKGYPVFTLERLERAGFGPFLHFCSYLAADWKSTVRLYASALRNMGKCISFILPIYIVTLFVMFGVSALVEAPRSPKPPGQSDMMALSWVMFSWVASFVVLFLLFYTVFFASRRLLRARIRRAISTKKFSESFLPQTLDDSLRRVDLLAVLYRGDLLAEHEADRTNVRNT